MRKIETEGTLCFPIRDNQVLLAMKKRGFGKGRWNGFGGKAKPGETLKGAAVREVREESELVVAEDDLEEVAVIDFFFREKPEWDQRVYTFFVRRWEGEPKETEEMKPQWFDVAAVPYDGECMWPEDKLWLPRVLQGEKIRGEVTFRDLKGNAESVDLRNVT